MTDRLITHLRHLDLAVPDHKTQLDFYVDAWGLKAEHSEPGLTFLAAEGSPEQYVVRLRQAPEKRIGLIVFGAATAADVDTLAGRLAADGVGTLRNTVVEGPDLPLVPAARPRPRTRKRTT